jgi:hypothetical protein
MFMAFFNYVNPWLKPTPWPLRCSAPGDGMPPCGRADFGLRSGNFVWRHVLHMGPSTGCRLAFAQVVAAAAVRCFWSIVLLWVSGLLCSQVVLAIGFLLSPLQIAVVHWLPKSRPWTWT